MTLVLHFARISNVDSVMFVNGITKMVRFEPVKEIEKDVFRLVTSVRQRYMESVMWLSGEASESIGVRNPSFTELSFIYSISFFSCSNQTFGDTITTNTINYYFYNYC